MNISLRTQKSSSLDLRPAANQLAACLMLGTLIHASTLFSASAGTFTSDFNASLPNGTAVFGNATNDLVGGLTNSGTIKLTTTGPSQTGSFVITNDLDAGQPVVSFTANFKALIGGGNGADGFGFNFAPDLPFSATGEEGAGTGLTVSFDTYAQTGDTTAPEIEVRVGGAPIATTSFSAGALRAGVFVDVVIQLNPDGTLNVIYDGVYAHTNLSTGLSTITGGFFGFGARTGGLNDNHFIDNLNITTHTNASPFVQSFAPRGRTVRADAPIKIILTDNTTAVDTSSLILKLDDTAVTPVVTQSAPDTTISFVPPALFASGSSHTVSLVFADNATPTPNTNTLEYGFTVSTYGTLATNLAADPAFVNLNSPGFSIRYSQVADLGSRDIARAESQLAGLLIDGSTGLPYDNLAAPNPVDSSFTFLETNVVNYGLPAGSTGNFPGDTDVPGIPGPTTGNGSSYAMNAVTYLHLAPGLYALGVNSSDGFKLTVADGADVFAPTQASFSGVRAAADSTVSFAVTADGYYPFRLVYFTGDPAYGPGPGTTVPNVEFFSVDNSGNKILINDTNVAGYVPAFTAASTKPHIQSVSPDIGDSGVPGNTAISATLIDGSLTVQTNTILLQVNGTTVTPTISSNAGVSTVSYQPPAAFPPNSSNYVTIAFTDSGANRRTNTWSFTVANIMSPIWSTPAVNGTWVTAGSTERGLAYNPKTGHLLLVSRASAASGSPANGLGVAILDSSNGNVIGTLNLGSGVIVTAGVTFPLNIVDVADDGAIYICNLSVSANQPFIIYRWQDESATPTIAFQQNPPFAAGGPSRVGDDFRVRGSGAGTQIIVSGNSAVTTAPLFTTADGINFTPTVLNISGIAANIIRLGLAFGCGNTFYGETTGQPMSYVGFNGVPSTIANLIASYGIYDKNTNQSIGPIGVDIVNQRLIGNQTVAPHNINLYDMTSLVITPTRNFPIDQRNYASQNTSFGTGFVDFTADGSRVYCLDTGNGIIAFNLAPKLATPNICAQPQNHIVAGPGSLGFMDVMAIGAPQRFQWRFNGVPIANATNRTLDISDVQTAKLGFYSVIISNATLGLSVTSAPAYLDTLMVVTNPIVDQVVAIGGTATFDVGVSNGLPGYTYQWRLNGGDIVTATNSSFSVTNAQVANAGAYTVAITDSLGQTIISPGAVLTVGTIGTGTGLTGDYYSSQLQTFTGPPALTRVDPTVNFDFGTGSPDPAISVDQFTIRWTGQVQPFYSQTYTFYTTTDDGVRLWVNGQLLVNSWIDQGPTERSGTIALAANQKYDIVMEYYENGVGAVARLAWSSPGQVKGIIPQTQLYPGASPVQPVLSSGFNNGTSLILNWGGTFQLESSTNVAGPYAPVVGITNSPYTNIIGLEPEMYFRLLNQY